MKYSFLPKDESGFQVLVAIIAVGLIGLAMSAFLHFSLLSNSSGLHLQIVEDYVDIRDWLAANASCSNSVGASGLPAACTSGGNNSVAILDYGANTLIAPPSSGTYTQVGTMNYSLRAVCIPCTSGDPCGTSGWKLDVLAKRQSGGNGLYLSINQWVSIYSSITTEPSPPLCVISH
jgi:hypothetical protein